MPSQFIYLIRGRNNNFKVQNVTASDFHRDKRLFKQISAGDEKAFRALFDLYKVDLYRIVFKLNKSQVVAEEIIQELFIGLWISREHLHKVEDPSSYLYRILLNKLGRFAKKEASQKSLRNASLSAQSSTNITEEVIDAHETQRMIEQALVKLPKNQKIVYRLSRQEGLSNYEIASQLHVSTNTVKSHLYRAIWFIRSHLKS
jgi:RNA polymerase sigma-70 factor (ECF subfamily)